ncbi:hypothetical protein L6R52_41040 [Myxococcota bacterium]|nr:hypothetical protein [Myxococcota bacterium]
MGREGCAGGGTGWGTIEGLKIRVLLLADPARHADAAAIQRALVPRHDAHLLGGKRLFGALEAAKAAQALRPHLVHAVGLTGRAKSARTIAAGMRVPLTVSLTTEDVAAAKPKTVLAVAAEAAAVIVERGATADQLRALGVTRDIYVVSPPPAKEDDAMFLGAIEIVYGRVLGDTPELLEGAAPDDGHHDHDGAPLVQLGKKKS